MSDFDEFGNDLSEPCPTRDEIRTARIERENAIRAKWAARERERLADDTLVNIAPVADDGLGAEFESEPFANAAIRDAERDEREREFYDGLGDLNAA